MKIEASKRLRAQEGEWVDASTVVNRLQNSIQKLFPKSYVDVSVDKSLGRYHLDISFTLGAGRQDYTNGIPQNDAARNFWIVHGVVSEDGKSLRVDANYKVGSGLTFMVPSKRPHMAYAYDVVKVTRAFTAKNLNAFIKRVEGDFAKLAKAMKQDVEGVSQAQGKDMSSYLR